MEDGGQLCVSEDTKDCKQIRREDTLVLGFTAPLVTILRGAFTSEDVKGKCEP